MNRLGKTRRGQILIQYIIYFTMIKRTLDTIRLVKNMIQNGYVKNIHTLVALNNSFAILNYLPVQMLE